MRPKLMVRVPLVTDAVVDLLENRLELQHQPLVEHDVLGKIVRRALFVDELVQPEVRRELRVLIFPAVRALQDERLATVPTSRRG